MNVRSAEHPFGMIHQLICSHCLFGASRPEPNEPSLAAFAGKVAGLMAASPGNLGGLRGLVTLRSILGNIQVLVIPEQVAVVKAHEAFNADGTLKDDKQRGQVENLGKKIATLVKKLQG